MKGNTIIHSVHNNPDTHLGLLTLGGRRAGGSGWASKWYKEILENYDMYSDFSIDSRRKIGGQNKKL